jgi:exopolysaccharide biosynthesis polyprenyl glycosylphosphotransferase
MVNQVRTEARERTQTSGDAGEVPVVRSASRSVPRAAPRSLSLRISERRVALILGDISLSALSVFIALCIWAYAAGHDVTTEFVVRHWYWFLVLPLLWYLLANANDYYNLQVSARIRSSLRRLFWIVLQLLVIYVTIFFLSPRDRLPRLFIVYYAAVSLLLIGSWRACRLFLVGWTGFRRRALVVGIGKTAELIWKTLEQEAPGDYELVGCVMSCDDFVPTFPGARVVGTAAELPQLISSLGVSELIVTYVNAVPADVFQGVMASYTQGVTIMPMPILYEEVTRRVPIEHVGEHLWTLVLPFEGETLRLGVHQFMKRVLDIVVALCGLVVFACLLPVVALAIKLDSRGPVFYRQERLGRGGRVFTILKLRSMREDAEVGAGPRWAAARDPRVTRVGRLLRKTRLDEVPQLWNVLRGDMSLVGPRPERPVFVDQLADAIPFYRSRLVVKPGITGWAQVCYPYGNSVEDALRKLQYDLYYIRHQSLMRDLAIMLRTVGTMLLFRGT